MAMGQLLVSDDAANEAVTLLQGMYSRDNFFTHDNTAFRPGYPASE